MCCFQPVLNHEWTRLGGGFEPRMDTNGGPFFNHEWTRMGGRCLTTNGHEWTRIDVARAVQPEFGPLRLDCLEIDAAGPGCRRLASREAAKPQSSKGAGTWGRGDWCDVLSGSTFHFLQSAIYGMDAIPPSPPTPLPRFTGARGGLGVGGQARNESCFRCDHFFSGCSDGTGSGHLFRRCCRLWRRE